MTTKDVNVNQLATAVMWWLSYTSAVGRNYVLSEGSIKFPASEYLERSTVDEIELEYGHPELSRKRFDLFFRKNSIEKTAFEFKYIKNGSTRTQDEKQRVFNDLMRVHLFLDTDHKAYLLICGNQSDFIKDFQKIIPSKTQFITPRTQGSLPATIVSEGFYTKWFSFDSNLPDTQIDLDDTVKEYKEIYDLFFKEYADPHKTKAKTDLLRPSKIKTSLVFISGNVDQPTSLFQPAKIGIWEVSKA
jgi:hypothetical protein